MNNTTDPRPTVLPEAPSEELFELDIRLIRSRTDEELPPSHFPLCTINSPCDTTPGVFPL